MTNRINNGGAAFPCAEQQGMTYRQWLAGMALQGMIACGDEWGSFEKFAENAVKFADALIAELEKE